MIPKHVSIVLDGNRRFSKKKGWKDVWRGHEIGFGKIEELLEWCREFQVEELTLFCFSTENFKRDKNEVNYLFNLFRKRIADFIADSRIHEHEIKVRFIGSLEKFPKDIIVKMNKLMADTSQNGKFKLNFALGYGSRQEIIDTVKKIIDIGFKAEDINEKIVAANMYGISDVDLFIRPGGEKRLSNFLLWQSSYAELWFTDKLWPEFAKVDFLDAVNWFKSRKRRFGQ